MKETVIKEIGTSVIKERAFIPGIGDCEIAYCTEAMQDIESRNVAYSSPRTPEPSEEEVSEWRKYYEYYKNLDIEGVKSRYDFQFIRESHDKPYETYEYVKECDDKLLEELSRSSN